MKFKNRKRYLAWILVGLMSMSVAACGSGGIGETEGTAENTEAAGVGEETTAISQLEDFDPAEYVADVTYMGVEMDVEDSSLTEDEFEEILGSFLASYGEKEKITDRVTQDGDVIVMDYSGSVDGVAFDGGTATYQTVTVGDSGFIDGLDQALIGAPCGEEFVTNVTFPETYANNPDLAGVEAQFTVLIHYIQGEEIIPELTDEFVQGLEDYDCSTVEEFRKAYCQELSDMKAEAYEYQNMNNLWTQILNEATFSDYPEGYVDAYYNDMISTYNYYASAYGIELEDYVACYGYEIDDFYALVRENAELQVKSEILYRYIAQAEGIVATEEEYLDIIQEYMDAYGYTDIASFENDFGADAVKEQGYADATLQKVLKFCYENAVLHVISEEEVEVTAAE